MFGFGQIIHNDNSSNSSRYKQDKKQTFKTYKINHWTDTDKPKESKRMKTTNYKDDDTTPSVKYYNYVVFEPPEIAEPKYQIFKGAEYEKQYDVEKGRYNNITPSDLLYKAYQENDTYGSLGRDPNELKTDLMARIALDDPNEDQYVQKTLGELITETPAARSLLKTKAKENKLDIRPLTRQQKQQQTLQYIQNLTPDEKENSQLLDKQIQQVLEPYIEATQKRDRRSSAIQIQSAFRGHKARKIKVSKKLKKGIENKIKKNASTKIQKMFRGHSLRKKMPEIMPELERQKQQIANETKQMEEEEQTTRRSKEQAQKLKKEPFEKASVPIQKIARGFMARRKAQRMREEEFERDLEREQSRRIRNKKLGVVDAEIVNDESKELPTEQIIENLGDKNFKNFRAFVLGGAESTFKNAVSLRDLQTIVQLINKEGGNLEYQNRTKKQMIADISKYKQNIRERLFS